MFPGMNSWRRKQDRIINNRMDFMYWWNLPEFRTSLYGIFFRGIIVRGLCGSEKLFVFHKLRPRVFSFIMEIAELCSRGIIRMIPNSNPLKSA